MGAQPRRPPGTPNGLRLMTTESHYSSLSCKRLSAALTRATEESRELSPRRGAGRGASSQPGAAQSYWNRRFPPGVSSRNGEPWPAVLPSPALPDQGPPLQRLSPPWGQ